MRLLIIEDSKEYLDFLKKGFQAECFAVDTARDGEEGFYLARTNTYDIIILDNLLPKMKGLDLCKALREQGKTTPIIILSVKSEALTKVALLNAGADDYLSKPASFDELLARVRALLRRPGQILTEVLELADISLNTRKQTVHCREKEVYLTRKEFMLLEFLMKNKGSVLSRAMIMEHVWDMSVDPFSNTIEAHILSLRRKLAHENKHDLIQTVPGRGYKIDVPGEARGK